MQSRIESADARSVSAALRERDIRVFPLADGTYSVNERSSFTGHIDVRSFRSLCSLVDAYRHLLPSHLRSLYLLD